jgi:hypothetical protein
MRLERAVNEADKLDLVDPETLRTALDGYVGMPGVMTLRTMLDRHTFRLRLRLFRPLALSGGFPLPLTKHRVLGYEVGFWFSDRGLAIETDRRLLIGAARRPRSLACRARHAPCVLDLLDQEASVRCRVPGARRGRGSRRH